MPPRPATHRTRARRGGLPGHNSDRRCAQCAELRHRHRRCCSGAACLRSFLPDAACGAASVQRLCGSRQQRAWQQQQQSTATIYARLPRSQQVQVQERATPPLPLHVRPASPSGLHAGPCALAARPPPLPRRAACMRDCVRLLHTSELLMVRRADTSDAGSLRRAAVDAVRRGAPAVQPLEQPGVQPLHGRPRGQPPQPQPRHLHGPNGHQAARLRAGAVPRNCQLGEHARDWERRATGWCSCSRGGGGCAWPLLHAAWAGVLRFLPITLKRCGPMRMCRPSARTATCPCTARHALLCMWARPACSPPARPAVAGAAPAPLQLAGQDERTGR